MKHINTQYFFGNPKNIHDNISSIMFLRARDVHGNHVSVGKMFYNIDSIDCISHPNHTQKVFIPHIQSHVENTFASMKRLILSFNKGSKQASFFT